MTDGQIGLLGLVVSIAITIAGYFVIESTHELSLLLVGAGMFFGGIFGDVCSLACLFDGSY